MSDERQLQSGSGQQLVTAAAISNSHNGLWQVREANDDPHCDTAAPIKCGEIIRLTHLGTNNNLHTHGIKSPLSNQHEVTGFGNGSGEGDSGDDWRVMCSGGGEYWLRGGEVSFRSTATSRYLGAASNIKFSEQNCGRLVSNRFLLSSMIVLRSNPIGLLIIFRYKGVVQSSIISRYSEGSKMISIPNGKLMLVSICTSSQSDILWGMPQSCR